MKKVLKRLFFWFYIKEENFGLVGRKLEFFAQRIGDRVWRIDFEGLPKCPEEGIRIMNEEHAKKLYFVQEYYLRKKGVHLFYADNSFDI
jgi:hypothetical protein